MPSAISSPGETEIFSLFRYCQQVFISHGVRLAFPANTDPRKTYKWRYLESFLRQISEWNLSIATSYKLIDAMVEHADKYKQLRQRGLAILTSKQILEIGHKAIMGSEKSRDEIIEILERDIRFLSQYPNRLIALLYRNTPREMPNIVKWHNMDSALSSTFLSISRSCAIAMQRLTPTEKLMMPSNLQLHNLRGKCITPVVFKYRIRTLMGDDWGLVC